LINRELQNKTTGGEAIAEHYFMVKIRHAGWGVTELQEHNCGIKDKDKLKEEGH